MVPQPPPARPESSENSGRLVVSVKEQEGFVLSSAVNQRRDDGGVASATRRFAGPPKTADGCVPGLRGRL